ncbi:hypothetical protein [Glycomyces sp. NPDC048151]|uniref:hypothetical protein n=1 Tax=Glycomyces sp. NPDC048151 TaxID=3364002 RepID=UPI003710F479
MALVQPDLFGEWEARQERDRAAALPATCPCCGTEEPNSYLLLINHGIEEDGTVYGAPRGEHPIFEDRCAAQDLTRNHIWYAVTHGLDELARDVARGRELGLDTDAIIAEARTELGGGS